MLEFHWQVAYRELRNDPSVRYTVKSTLAAAMDSDPVDAHQDALLIVKVLAARCDEINGTGDGIVRFDTGPAIGRG